MKGSKQIRQTTTQEQENDIEALAKDYRMKGKSDEEADKLARTQVLKSEEDSERDWQEFVKKINLHDIVDDMLRRAMIAYREEYNKIHPDQKIDFKFTLSGDRSHKGTAVFIATLKFEVQRGGVWELLQNKKINFPHVREARKEVAWKFALWEAMLQALMFNAITYTILLHDNRKQQPTI